MYVFTPSYHKKFVESMMMLFYVVCRPIKRRGVLWVHEVLRLVHSKRIFFLALCDQSPVFLQYNIFFVGCQDDRNKKITNKKMEKWLKIGVKSLFFACFPLIRAVSRKQAVKKQQAQDKKWQAFRKKVWYNTT